MEKIYTQIAQGHYTLIEGNFNPEEGTDIVNEMIEKKISLHRLRGFTDQLRFCTENFASKRRITELQKTQREFNELAKEAKAQGKTLRIISTIHVELMD